jgi:hypothetical protein
MTVSKKALRASLAATSALMAFPAAGLAADSATSTTVGSELSVAAPATTVLSGLTHATPAAGNTIVAVTSTSPSWTLTASDEGLTAGHMVSETNSLVNPLAVSSVGGGSGDLTEAGISAADGAAVASRTFSFVQSLVSGEDVLRGDVYGLTVTYTATDNEA